METSSFSPLSVLPRGTLEVVFAITRQGIRLALSFYMRVVRIDPIYIFCYNRSYFHPFPSVSSPLGSLGEIETECVGRRIGCHSSVGFWSSVVLVESMFHCFFLWRSVKRPERPTLVEVCGRISSPFDILCRGTGVSTSVWRNGYVFVFYKGLSPDKTVTFLSGVYQGCLSLVT